MNSLSDRFSFRNRVVCNVLSLLSFFSLSLSLSVSSLCLLSLLSLLQSTPHTVSIYLFSHFKYQILSAKLQLKAFIPQTKANLPLQFKPSGPYHTNLHLRHPPSFWIYSGGWIGIALADLLLFPCMSFLVTPPLSHSYFNSLLDWINIPWSLFPLGIYMARDYARSSHPPASLSMDERGSQGSSWAVHSLANLPLHIFPLRCIFGGKDTEGVLRARCRASPPGPGCKLVHLPHCKHACFCSAPFLIQGRVCRDFRFSMEFILVVSKCQEEGACTAKFANLIHTNIFTTNVTFSWGGGIV